MGNKKHISVWICLLLVFLSRLPFINIGYGAEEDAWGLRITAENISRTGLYEVSRLPGHPLQELIYAQLWQYGPLMFNLLTLIISTIGIAFFILSLKKLNIRSSIAAGMALAFTPVIYINCMNAMDYTWAMSFIVIAFYLLISGRLLWAGIFTGLAIGCRITSAAMLLPFLYYLFSVKEFNYPNSRKIIFLITALTVACLLFLPVYNTYGPSFFRYYEYFDIPSFAKNFYKGTIGVWGFIGCIAVCIVLFRMAPLIIMRYRKKLVSSADNSLLIFCGITIILYFVAFIKLPLKSAFLIPIIPFVIISIAVFESNKMMNLFVIGMIASCFLFGINLSNNNRGSDESSLAINFIVSGQNISFDPIVGPVIADITKQKKIISYAHAVLEETAVLKNPAVIISGWYLNFILALKGDKSEASTFVYFINEHELKKFKDNDYVVYYLEEQEKFNDIRYKGDFTKKYTLPLIVNSTGRKP